MSKQQDDFTIIYYNKLAIAMKKNHIYH